MTRRDASRKLDSYDLDYARRHLDYLRRSVDPEARSILYWMIVIVLD